MKFWIFDMGDSTHGDVGYVLTVKAKTKKEAVKKALKLLPEAHGVEIDDLEWDEGLTVCLNIDPKVMRKRLEENCERAP